MYQDLTLGPGPPPVRGRVGETITKANPCNGGRALLEVASRNIGVLLLIVAKNQEENEGIFVLSQMMSYVWGR